MSNYFKFERYIPENTRPKLGSRSRILPINGRIVYEKFIDDPLIIMAANPRITYVIPGIMRAAEELDAIVAFELAKTECNLEGGYTGQTPESFVETVLGYAEELGFTKPFIIHADHQQVRSTKEEEISDTERLIAAEIKAGYTSFAIDASHNEMEDNIQITERLARPILDLGLGLEGEVGEIKLVKEGGELTTVEEALEYVSTLKGRGVNLNLLAINNGSKHGNYAPGEEVHIDLERTGAIYRAIRPYNVAVAQHGITGTPVHLIGQFADYGIRKGNVGTNWQNIAHENLPPDLFDAMKKWAEDNKKDIKFTTKVFKRELDTIPEEYKKRIADASYISAKEFIINFRSQATASLLEKRL
jgi:fructose-bisphosphate aldolase class II